MFKPFSFRHKGSTSPQIVLCALTCVVGLLQPACAESIDTETRGAVRPSTTTTAIDPLLAARCSLHLKNEPLEQMLEVLGRANDLRFRFAVVPDATVTVALNDALLLPALDNVLHVEGFHSVRRDRQIWVASRRSALPSTALLKPERQPVSRGALNRWRQNEQVEARAASSRWPATWQIWTRPTPPGKGWMAPLALKTPVSTAQRRADNIRTTTPPAIPSEPPLSLSGWQTLSLDFAPDPFGVAVLADQSTLMAMSSVAQTPNQSPPSSRTVWLRWPFWLRQLPRGAQLRLHTSGQATLWINGARVLPRWSGPQLLEVDNLLQTGFNCLAFECTPAISSTGLQLAPLLRYEWLFAKS
jgi:hypothetical protein